MNHTQQMNKVILDLCGGTGAWSKPYKDNGYEIRIIDFKEWSKIDSAGDIRLFKRIKEPVYGILAAPPCTHFAGSGARWWKDKGVEPLKDGLSVVDAVFRIVSVHHPKFWVLENPVGRLIHYIGKPKHIFNPCDYGDPYTKKTCLWGEFNIPKRNEVIPVHGCDPIHNPRKNGKKLGWNTIETKRLRSITPPGFAKAFYEANK